MTTQVTMIFTGVPGEVTEALGDLSFRPDRIAISSESFARDTYKIVITATSLVHLVSALLVIFPDPIRGRLPEPTDPQHVRVWLAGVDHGQRVGYELATKDDGVPAVDREDVTPVPYGWGSTDLPELDPSELTDANDYRIITFGPDHKHPITDESLAGKYVRLPGGGERTRDLALLIFGQEWSHQYLNEILSPIDKFSLKPISPAPRFDERGFWRGWEES